MVTVSSNAPTLAEMLGLAVGIDYALFILSRYRRHLGEGRPAESMARALATAGSAVVFAGATVDHRARRPFGGPDPGASP